MITKKALFWILLAFQGCFAVFGAICGPDSVPYKFSAYPNGQVVTECSRPTCFDANSNSLNGYFYRATSRFEPGIQDVESGGNFHLAIMKCFRISNQQPCPIGTQLLPDPTFQPSNASVCCRSEHAPFTHENNGTVLLGTEITGGEVVFEERQIGFDYISDATLEAAYSNTTSYRVRTRRLNCPSTTLPAKVSGNEESFKAFADQNTVKSEVQNLEPLEEGQRSRVHADPTQIIDPSQPDAPARANAAPTYVYANGQDVYIPGSNPNAPPTYVQANGQDVVIEKIPVYQPWYYYPTQAVQRAGALFCFSADTEVTTAGGVVKRMDELEIGDWVMSFDKNEIIYSQVKSWIHKLPQEETEFIKMSLEDGTELKITSQHLIYKGECTAHGQKLSRSSLPKAAVPSDEVQVGDCLYVRSNEAFEQKRVIDLVIVNGTGVYSPLTASGNIITNNITASCYSVTQESNIQSQYNKVDLPLSSQILLDMAKVILPFAKF